MNERVARSRALVANGHRPTTVTRVLQVSRQSVYRPLSRRPSAAGPGKGRPGDEAIVEVAKNNPTDGTRMVAALTSRELGVRVNRRRVQRVMRAHKLLQKTIADGRRRRPGYFRVTRPDELWHIDMTKVWAAAHGWVYLHAMVDCCTRELAGGSVDLRCRDDEAIAAVDAAVVGRGFRPGRLTLGSDNGSQFTSRRLPPLPVRPWHRTPPRRLPRPGVPGLHRVLVRPIQEALRLACGMGTIERARTEIAAYIQNYHHRPHSGLAYRTPGEVAATWRGGREPEKLQILAI